MTCFDLKKYVLLLLLILESIGDPNPIKREKLSSKKFCTLVCITFVALVDKNIIHSYIPFLLEYEITNSLLTFSRNHRSGKKLVLDLWSKNL